MSASVFQSTASEIEDAIREAFKNLQVPSLRRVLVSVQRETVTLSGQVHTFYAKQLAHQAARLVAGERAVIDEISVQPPAGFCDPIRLRLAATAGLALALLLVLSGCSRQEAGQVAVYPVRGRVLFADKPAAGALVVFHAKGDANAEFPAPRAKTDQQGNFEVTTYRKSDGAPPGEYVVTIELNSLLRKDGENVPGPPLIPTTYNNRKTSTLVARITEGDNDIPLRIVR